MQQHVSVSDVRAHRVERDQQDAVRPLALAALGDDRPRPGGQGEGGQVMEFYLALAAKSVIVAGGTLILLKLMHRRSAPRHRRVGPRVPCRGDGRWPSR